MILTLKIGPKSHPGYLSIQLQHCLWRKYKFLVASFYHKVLQEITQAVFNDDL